MPAAAPPLADERHQPRCSSRGIAFATEVAPTDGDRRTTVVAGAASAASCGIRLPVLQAAAQAGCAVWAHLAAGSILAVAPDLRADAVRALRDAARERGGFLQIESAPSALRREVDPFDLTERTLVAALKREFDPRGTLNRGRWQEDV